MDKNVKGVQVHTPHPTNYVPDYNQLFNIVLLYVIKYTFYSR